MGLSKTGNEQALIDRLLENRKPTKKGVSGAKEKKPKIPKIPKSAESIPFSSLEAQDFLFRDYDIADLSESSSESDDFDTDEIDIKCYFKNSELEDFTVDQLKQLCENKWPLKNWK